MRAKIAICLLLAALTAACAGLGIGGGAKSEFEEGLRLYNAGQYAKAAAHFQRATEQEPEYAEAFLYLGRSYLNQGQWSKSLPPLRTAWRLAPDDMRGQVLDVLMDAFIGAGTSAFEAGNFTDAVGFLREGLQLAPKDSAARQAVSEQMLNLGGRLLSEGRPMDAVGMFQALLQGSPDTRTSLSAYLGLAKAYLRDGRFMDALQAATEATRLDPGLHDPNRLLDSLR